MRSSTQQQQQLYSVSSFVKKPHLLILFTFLQGWVFDAWGNPHRVTTISTGPQNAALSSLFFVVLAPSIGFKHQPRGNKQNKLPFLFLSSLLVISSLSATGYYYSASSTIIPRKSFRSILSTMASLSSTPMNAIVKDEEQMIDIDVLLEPCRMEWQQKSSSPISLEWRRNQLLTMKRMIQDHQDEFCNALTQDLGKSSYEGYIGEVTIIVNEIDELLRILPEYASRGGKSPATTHVASPGLLVPAFSQYRYDPLTMGGSTPGKRCANLVIGPFNYPLQLSLIPCAGSLAAGNPTILKPSELCPHTSNLMKLLIHQYFEKGVLQVVEGGIDETSLLIHQSCWGMIFFTGSTRVGKIVAKAAADTLTPTVLELGGKSPVYIDSIQNVKSNLQSMVNRIVWGKTFNGGQTCVAPDYILCHESTMDQFCYELVQAFHRMYSDNGSSAKSGQTTDPSMEQYLVPASEQNSSFHTMARIINDSSTKRLIGMIQEAEAETDKKSCDILCGGSSKCDVSQRYVAPTFMKEPPLHLKVWKEELFGPLLPIKSVSSREEAISFIQNMPGTPLALYVFTNNARTFEQFSMSCPSGALVRNDVMVHFPSHYLPTGGLGTSGWGNYHGHHSIQSFSHKRAILNKPAGTLFDYGGIRFAPHTAWKRKALPMLMNLPRIPPLVRNHPVLIGGVILASLTCVLVKQNNAVANNVAAGLITLSQWIQN